MPSEHPRLGRSLTRLVRELGGELRLPMRTLDKTILEGFPQTIVAFYQLNGEWYAVISVYELLLLLYMAIQ